MKPYGTSFRIDDAAIRDELIRLVRPGCPSYDVNRQVAWSSALRNIQEPSKAPLFVSEIPMQLDA